MSQGARQASDVVSHSDVMHITPFWLRMPLFFRYPFYAGPFFYMVVLALATLLGFVVPLPVPLDHLVVHAGVWLAFIRYAYKTLDQTAVGVLTPDDHPLQADSDRNSLPYKQTAIMIVMGFVVGFAHAAGGVVYGAALIFMVLSFPASVMNLTMTRSFWAGLNPLAAVRMMRVVGLPYLALCGFLFLLMTSEQLLQIALLPRLPPWMLLPALNLVGMYFTLIMFNMMGYVVYQHHHMLGVSLRAPLSGSGAKSGDGQSSSDEIGRLIGEGQIDEALDLAYEAQRVAPEDIAAQDRYHKLLALAGRNDRLLSHAKGFLSLLLRKNRGEEALALWRSMRERDSGFEPEQAGSLLRLAEVLRKRRDFNEALVLLKGFDRRFPRHAEIPAVYLFVAQMLSENLRQDASARQLLAVLLSRYPEHETSGEARQLMTVIDRLQVSQSAA